MFWLCPGSCRLGSQSRRVQILQETKILSHVQRESESLCSRDDHTSVHGCVSCSRLISALRTEHSSSWFHRTWNRTWLVWSQILTTYETMSAASCPHWNWRNHTEMNSFCREHVKLWRLDVFICLHMMYSWLNTKQRSAPSNQLPPHSGFMSYHKENQPNRTSSSPSSSQWRNN